MKRLNEASSVTRTGTCSVVAVMMEGAGLGPKFVGPESLGFVRAKHHGTLFLTERQWSMTENAPL